LLHFQFLCVADRRRHRLIAVNASL